MDRYYQKILFEHFEQNRQMFFIAGPRQVGKTTLSLSIKSDHEVYYLNWDNLDNREMILAGPEAIAQFAHYQTLSRKFLIFDEIHKYKRWKSLLKGFFDTYQDKFNIIVTGSAKLDIYQRGGDSLMGRYFLYRIAPLSLSEVASPTMKTDGEMRAPYQIDKQILQDLLIFGGFPEPFIKKNHTFYRKWKNLRIKQLFNEDIKQLEDIRSVAEIELLAHVIQVQVGSMLNRSNLSKKIKVSVPTIDKWIALLEKIYFIYLIKPWHKNISRSLIKEPKVYLWDWSQIDDPGARFENLIASHLLKAVYAWTDQGAGEYDLFYLRDKDKKEVDFLVTKNNTPWFLVEAKCSQSSEINRYLAYFQKATKAKHAFQVVLDAEFVNVDCFSRTDPVIVPALTFLSQLI